MIRFHAPDIADNPTLPESDSQHCIRVLRMKEGDEIEVVDGYGSVFRCRIAVAHPKRTLLEIIERHALPKVWLPEITIAIAPTKHLDRMEWLVEKLVEIGVDNIVPLKCRHSERKELKVERLEKIAVSAMKQSLKAILPHISEMVPLNSFISQNAGSTALRYIGYCDSATERRLLARDYVPGKDVIVMIGPEGDFSPEEVKASTEAGYVPVTLGDNRLRTETAALVACDTIQIINQRYTSDKNQ